VLGSDGDSASMHAFNVTSVDRCEHLILRTVMIS